VLFRSGERAAIMHVTGRDVEEKEYGLTWDSGKALWFLSAEGSEVYMSPERLNIIKVLKEIGTGVTPMFVSLQLKKSYNTVKKTLWDMSKEGLISVFDGKYAYNSENIDNNNNNNKSNPSTPTHPDNPSNPGNPSNHVTPYGYQGYPVTPPRVVRCGLCGSDNLDKDSVCLNCHPK